MLMIGGNANIAALIAESEIIAPFRLRLAVSA